MRAASARMGVIAVSIPAVTGDTIIALRGCAGLFTKAMPGYTFDRIPRTGLDRQSRPASRFSIHAIPCNKEQ